MPKVPHGSGLDVRGAGAEYLRKLGFGHWEVRKGVTEHGGIRVVGPGVVEDWPRQEHGWAEGFPIGTVVGSGLAGQWDFSVPEQSGHLLTAGL